MTEESVLELWAEALRAAWMYAKGERARELRGDRSVRRYDARGLHPYSFEWGRVLAYEVLLHDLMILRFTGEPSLDPISMRKLAAREAEQEFAEALLARQVAAE